jgi:hypothetical protein
VTVSRRNLKWLVRPATVLALILAAGCSQKTTSGAAVTAASSEPSPYLVTATIQDIMQSVVDPNADALWESVATISDEHGITEKQPRTDEEWAAVRHSAIAVIEGSNLLLMPGRKVVAPGKTLEDSDVEGILKPEEIQKLIDNDRATLIDRAHGLHSAGMAVLAAIDARNPEALSEAGGALDEACENCHLKFWYPNQSVPGAPKQ